MSYSISTLLKRNLQDVFGEGDPERRRAAIDEIYTEDVVFYDPSKGVYRGRDEIDRIERRIKESLLAPQGPADRVEMRGLWTLPAARARVHYESTPRVHSNPPCGQGEQCCR